KSNQYNGITPDIEIPGLFDDQMPKENSFDTAFRNDSVESILNTSSFPMNEKQKQAILHYTQEAKTNKEFQKIVGFKTKFNQFYNNPLPPIPLQLNIVFDKLTEFGKRWKEIDDFIKIEYPFNVTNTSYDERIMKSNSYLESINKTQIKNLKTNFRIFEAIKIMGNLK
ncbi:MAG: hypothetical protein ABI426_11505, partial [Flavobacterium sp.]